MAAQESARLLTDLSAKVGVDGVELTWSVDESRASRITGFTCAYRTPAHIKLRVSGAVSCTPDGGILPDARSSLVAGLPEYGEYDFEVVANVNAGATIIWPSRALQVRVAVTEELAGAPAPDRAVTGTGPLIEGCGPDYHGIGRLWFLDDAVSSVYLGHPPSDGWQPLGDPAEPVDWPAPRLADLIGEIGTEQARLIAGARTRAFLHQDFGDSRELNLHSSFPFGSIYVFRSEHAVPGWADDSMFFPKLWSRHDCPPHGVPSATHDVALALTRSAGNGHLLQHSEYGWWTVAPVAMAPYRLVAVQGGLSVGAPDSNIEVDTRWRGRVSGHLFWNKRRWSLTGNVSLEARLINGESQLSGRIEDVVLAPIDLNSLEPTEGEVEHWQVLKLDSAPATDGIWAGALAVVDSGSNGGLAGFPAPETFEGDWRAAAYGRNADEIAGELRLWTPLADGTDPALEWSKQAVLVAGFGAIRTEGR